MENKLLEINLNETTEYDYDKFYSKFRIWAFQA